MLGVGIAMSIGASVQPFNVWLTKVRTGKEGFVGVENEKPDILCIQETKIGKEEVDINKDGYTLYMNKMFFKTY